ncbi:bifunctional 4-hydroxy-2-oxoglutarate aldolase/2-dehydro-3-deoxy-phosphogluconate aldolase [Spirochaeta thermophila]|uniref:Keto-hydroxyglutarate-aldolase/keto-deoxy-phosphogluconate aldolase n=1 Tax=Winmispira thermophila (strain ATCC 49972 / DSM 6192 / RI 19.B1) TaxID=665571 RepID=E0RPU1_WINT6|nr:bifunctional 4-hydroxy-2-oxoglutarate aldolase/2-dehydro-3-deoxy-phosphogluconate aldolase [Spirochaeta thermophila]ADN01405.1 keto-hydroxyglutarate-aldolase/keto-deoxy- phosphogluconate aldolase [Spirochaeta thermophila DSM 6192]
MIPRREIYRIMVEEGLIPVFFNPDPEVAKKIVDACAKGGARCIEMTNRGENAVAVFRELVAFCREHHPDLILGVGSVVDPYTAGIYIAEGAKFVVGPVFDREIALLCNSRKVPYIPGCGSATEIHEAEKYGAEICKVFPGKEVGGPGFVKSVLGPCPWTEIMPTGGVDTTEESLRAWFEAGVVAVGIGSKLITKERVKHGDFDAIAEDVKRVKALIAKIRSERGGT